MKNSFVVKCIAIVLFATFMTTLLLSGACIIFGFGSEAFVSSAKEQADNLEIISRTVEGAMNEMSLGINEITIAAHHVSDMANSTRENIDVLDKLLSKFTL